MTPTTIDQGGRATIASAQAQAALSAGDTQRARDKHAEAAAILEREAAQASGTETKHLALFLAATQYFKGGHYDKALALTNKIEKEKLPSSTRHLLPKFKQDVKARSSRDYVAGVLTEISRLQARRDFEGIINILQEHPYAMSPENLAYSRAICCANLGEYRTAVLFFIDAYKRSQGNPAVLAALAALPLDLASEGRTSEAREYVQVQLEMFPNAASYAIASFLSYQRAYEAENGAPRLLEEQLDYFARAREEFGRLSQAHQLHDGIRGAMALAYQGATLALYRSGDQHAAQEMCKATIAFEPSSPTAWTLRGIFASERTEAQSAFEKAIELGDQTYLPFYCLAHDAMTREDFSEALRRSQEALDRMLSRANEVTSLLYEWMAISLMHLRGGRADIEGYFKKATEAFPHNELWRARYAVFLESVPDHPPIEHNYFSRDTLEEEWCKIGGKLADGLAWPQKRAARMKSDFLEPLAVP